MFYKTMTSMSMVYVLKHVIFYVPDFLSSSFNTLQMETEIKNNFQCKYCSKKFSTTGNRSRHMKSVHEKNLQGEYVPKLTFTCLFCDKVYKSKSSLQDHMTSTHLSPKKYSNAKNVHIKLATREILKSIYL